MNFLLKLSDFKSDFKITLGYLNPALNNPGGKTKSFSHPIINFLHHVAASPGQTDPPQKEDILESPLKLNSNIK